MLAPISNILKNIRAILTDTLTATLELKQLKDYILNCADAQAVRVKVTSAPATTVSGTVGVSGISNIQTAMHYVVQNSSVYKLSNLPIAFSGYSSDFSAFVIRASS